MNFLIFYLSGLVLAYFLVKLCMYINDLDEYKYETPEMRKLLMRRDWNDIKITFIMSLLSWGTVCGSLFFICVQAALLPLFEEIKKKAKKIKWPTYPPRWLILILFLGISLSSCTEWFHRGEYSTIKVYFNDGSIDTITAVGWDPGIVKGDDLAVKNGGDAWDYSVVAVNVKYFKILSTGKFTENEQNDNNY